MVLRLCENNVYLCPCMLLSYFSLFRFLSIIHSLCNQFTTFHHLLCRTILGQPYCCLSQLGGPLLCSSLDVLSDTKTTSVLQVSLGL